MLQLVSTDDCPGSYHHAAHSGAMSPLTYDSPSQPLPSGSSHSMMLSQLDAGSDAEAALGSTIMPRTLEAQIAPFAYSDDVAAEAVALLNARITRSQLSLRHYPIHVNSHHLLNLCCSLRSLVAPQVCTNLAA